MSRSSVTVSQLRSQVTHQQQSRGLRTATNAGGEDLLTLTDDAPSLPLPAALADLIGAPGQRPGLQRGASYTVSGSTALLFALLAASTGQGHWCGLVGLPHLGFEAAAQVGVDVERLIVVAHPARHWLTATATLAEALPLIVVRPPTRPPSAAAARLRARLRRHATTMLVVGEAAWPHATASITASAHRWTGLGDGFGLLDQHSLRVSVRDRTGRSRHSYVRLAGDRIERVPPPATEMSRDGATPIAG